MKSDKQPRRLRDFGIDETFGFLGPMPLQSLPAIYEVWDKLIHQLPLLVSNNTVRDTLKNLQVIAIDELVTEPQLRRAHLLLSMFANAFVWGSANEGTEPDAILPPGVAIPLFNVAKSLDMPPIVTHGDVVLSNWKLIDPQAEVEPNNIAIMHTFQDLDDERWFFHVTAQCEWAGVPALHAVCRLLDAVEAEEPVIVSETLSDLAQAIHAMTAALRRMAEHCQPAVFYHQVRVFLQGWHNNAKIPQGVTFSGAVDEGPHAISGPSAGQSALLPVLDAVLRVNHGSAFLQHMRSFMPTQQRAFVSTLEQGPSLPEFVVAFEHVNPELHVHLQSCREELRAFRDYHIQIVARYILAQSRSGPNERGTGGSDIMPLLKSVRDAVPVSKKDKR